MYLTATTKGLLGLLCFWLGHEVQLTAAQLKSCDDVDCLANSNFTSCSLPDLGPQSLFSIGISEFSTDLSSQPLSWTVGEMPEVVTGHEKSPPAMLAFYLGQPADLSLREKSSIIACALFFSGVASRLTFEDSTSTLNGSTSTKTCEDALTARCVSDWTNQAKDLALHLDGFNYTCDHLANDLRYDPPDSCQAAAKDSWGDVAVRVINGQDLPSPVSTHFCNPTLDKTYSATNVYSVNGTKDSIANTITPIVTVINSGIESANGTAQATLNCLALLDDDSTPSTGFQGGSAKLQGSGFAWAIVVGLLLARVMI